MTMMIQAKRAEINPVDVSRHPCSIHRSTVPSSRTQSRPPQVLVPALAPVETPLREVLM